MASAVIPGPRRCEKPLSMTYIEPRFGALAVAISDWPEMPTVFSTPGVSWAMHHDISTIIGEEVVLFILARSPDFLKAKMK